MPGGTERNKMVLSVFFALVKLIIPQSLVCLKCTSPNLLHFFVPALPTHKPTLCGWLFPLLR